ncbi:terminase small subunit [Pseudomonas parakoreensis]|uniref:terminase small subunit n=1 Tax=Pseudomonas parakoreensis TaxID=2892331 RepID=UPI001F38725F|nr:terminase small subunit [Pseudomonas parakoreensis]
MALTDKKRRFVDSKAAGASNREAAEAAGYAAASASAAGSRLAKDPDVVAALEKLKARKDVKAVEKATASVSSPSLDDESDDLTELPHTDDPLVWLLALMNEPNAKMFDRRNAAQSALPYFHGKKSGMGKKEQKLEDAEKVGASTRFGLRERHLKAVK